MMTTLLLILALVVAVIAIGWLFLEKRPGYGVYYGIAKLAGGKLDIGSVDFATLTRRRSGNDALVCPPGHCPNAEADLAAKIYDMAPAQLLARLKKVALAEPRTRLVDGATDRGHIARFVQYSRLMRYPDTIDVEALPTNVGKSMLAIYSRSLVGRRDFGVNRARVARWLAALEQTF